MFRAPFWHFNKSIDNRQGTPSATVDGTNFTSGVNSAEGSVVTVLSALAFDAQFLVIAVNSVHTRTGTNGAIDVMHDPAGGTNWSELISNLVATGPNQSASVGYQHWYYFPLYIPAGTSLGIRGSHNAANNTSVTSQVLLAAFGEPTRPDMWWCGNKVQTIGMTGITPTNVTPGVSSAFGSWTNIGAVTAGRLGALQVGVGTTTTFASPSGYLWQVGAGNQVLPGFPTRYAYVDSGTVNKRELQLPMFCDIPAGTQLQIRAASSLGASPSTLRCALYGVY
jgi:hypothetical protein